MKQQILIINGGSTYPSYEEFLTHLKNVELKLDRLKPKKDWKDSLQEELGEDYEVFVPKMPNITNARYGEWKIWFEKVISMLDGNIILIGHSLGGVFLAKYLNENNVSKKVKATILIAAPYNNEINESLGEFKIVSPLNKFADQAGEVYLLQSKDDPVVSFGEFDKYKKSLPNAKTLVLDGMGHFKIEKFPELVDLIKNIDK